MVITMQMITFKDAPNYVENIFTCPCCGYKYIEMEFQYCPACGEEITWKLGKEE